MASNATAAAAAAAKCPGPMKATSQGAFQGESPLDYALPLAILQICLVVVLTRGLAYLLRPLRQPRVIAEIINQVPSPTRRGRAAPRRAGGSDGLSAPKSLAGGDRDGATHVRLRRCC
ncbi:hypothetical protein C2845_PM05G01600 [Panicum miliaceum]|uniref:Uncharacterized protein n=1 Tax=Panicum miliaceum TaxID=4540 RepID=A0A3L6SZW3_PANMI|nr:hypothetical protein C2845_PM05G01600 [Panicum miliaceum]